MLCCAVLCCPLCAALHPPPPPAGESSSISAAINALSEQPLHQRGWWVLKAGLPGTLPTRLWAAISDAELSPKQLAAGIRGVLRAVEQQEELAQLEAALMTLGGERGSA